MSAPGHWKSSPGHGLAYNRNRASAEAARARLWLFDCGVTVASFKVRRGESVQRRLRNPLRERVIAVEELPVQREPEQRDEDSSLARDDSNWFARQLGEQWRAEEPGIYRYVGPDRAGPDAQSPTEELGDALAPRGRHRPEFDRAEVPARQEREQP